MESDFKVLYKREIHDELNEYIEEGVAKIKEKISAITMEKDDY